MSNAQTKSAREGGLDNEGKADDHKADETATEEASPAAGSAVTPEEIEHIKAHIKVYLKVLGALAVLTVITVALSYLGVRTELGVALAMLVATAKAALVAAFFMHLIAEVNAIYATLIIGVFCFVAVMLLPVLTDSTLQNVLR